MSILGTQPDFWPSAQEAIKPLLAPYQTRFNAEVLEVGAGADAGKVRVARPGEPPDSGRPFYPVIGKTPAVGERVWCLSDTTGIIVIAGGGALEAHGQAHASDGSDPVPNVIADGASGLMQGADKAKLDAIGQLTQVEKNTVQSIPTNAWTEISWNIETQDDGEWWVSTSPERITPGITGKILWRADMNWASNTTGVRYVRIKKNGMQIASSPAASAANDQYGRGFVMIGAACAPADYFTVEVFHTVGANHDFYASIIGNPVFSATRLL